MATEAKPRTSVLKTHYKMRKLITEAEARYIIAHATTSSNTGAVLQHYDQWFDIRGLTEAEVADTLEDLDRERAANMLSGIANPN